MSDYIVRASAAEGKIRAFAATTRETVQEAREYIDDELDGREAWAQESSETFRAQARAHGRSVAVTIPSSAVRRLGVEVGDELEVTVRKARGRDRGRGRNTETPPAVPRRGKDRAG